MLVQAGQCSWRMGPVREDHPRHCYFLSCLSTGYVVAFPTLSAQSGVMKVEGPDSGEIKGSCGNKNHTECTKLCKGKAMFKKR